jgi:hypothetical protein
MRYLKIAAVMGLALAALTVQAKAQRWALWGTQTHSWVSSYQRWSGEPVVLPKAAKITAVETNAHSFCLWSAGKAVLCGSDEFPIEGKVLDKGRYTVFPDLAPAQKHCEVIVYLEEVKQP